MADSLSVQINAFATRVGTECKTLHAKIGDLSALTTTDKASAVVAINEVKSSLTTSIGTVDTKVTNLETAFNTFKDEVAASTNIDDTKEATTTTYSSSKIASEITSAKQAVKNDLLNGAGEAYDTLKELGDLIAANGASITTLQNLAAGHVKFDAAQTLTDEQKAQARSNIGAAAQADMEAANTAIAGKASQADLDALEALVGDVGTADFVGSFEAALNPAPTPAA